MDQGKIGGFIARLRREKGWTQEELGERLGVTNKTVSRWETGRYMPDIEMLTLLSRELGVSLNELVQGQRLETADTFRAAADENLASALKRPFLRFWKWLDRHYLSAIIVLLLALLLISLCVMHADYRRAHPIDTALPGTYCHYAADPIYLVFERDTDVFYRYQQFQPLEKGTYYRHSDDRVQLTVDGKRHDILIKGNCLYEPVEADGTGGFCVYEKFSDYPTFINVDTDIWPEPYVP